LTQSQNDVEEGTFVTKFKHEVLKMEQIT